MKTELEANFSDLHTYDGETGKVLTAKEVFSSGLTDSDHFDYDKVTHKQIWHERISSDGTFIPKPRIQMADRLS